MNQELRAIYQWLLFNADVVGEHHKFITIDRDGWVWVWTNVPVLDTHADAPFECDDHDSSIWCSGLSSCKHSWGPENEPIGKIPDHFLNNPDNIPDRDEYDEYKEWRHSLCKIEDVLNDD